MRKTALIVDDSKSARVVLKRILETHELDVDTAESAETALDYLNEHRPDVIFMDHLMPGMDGFEAVTAIKKNPATATIPIMMYTSQQGEVYVGQARALGAVGVLPKQVEPVEVSKILRSLRVIDAGEQKQQPVEETVEGDHPTLAGVDQDIRTLILDLFEQQRAVLRRDLLDSYETIASRVADEIRAPEPEAEKRAAAGSDNGVPGLLQAAVAALVVVVVIFGWLYWQREQNWQDARRQNESLMQALQQQQAIEAQSIIENQRRLDSFQQSIGSSFMSALSAIEWGINQNAQYAFNELPLDDARLRQFEEATSQLLNLGFSGEVRVETHTGDFCLVAGGTNGMQPAFGEFAAEQCDQIGFDVAEAAEQGSQQSVSFANFINITQEQTQGSIRYNVVSMGSSSPVIGYPSPGDVSARAWNDIAATNNRIEVSLIPDDNR
ncbi:MAG: response regulator [Gammaproteobacteria bacterium]|nr:response regulator [Gammaproteobacteria bacterium]